MTILSLSESSPSPRVPQVIPQIVPWKADIFERKFQVSTQK